MIYCRNYRSILPLTPSEMRAIWNRIEETPDGCWIWTGSLGTGGYGRIFLRGQYWQVHRLLYEILVGPVPLDRVLHHECRNEACCNPEHLDPVTHGENVTAGLVNGRSSPRRIRKYCRKGHELSEENVVMRRDHGKLVRVCRACEAAAYLRKNERRRLRRAATAALRSSARTSSHRQGRDATVAVTA